MMIKLHCQLHHDYQAALSIELMVIKLRYFLQDVDMLHCQLHHDHHVALSVATW
jgi:hypothetical protein